LGGIVVGKNERRRTTQSKSGAFNGESLSGYQHHHGRPAWEFKILQDTSGRHFWIVQKISTSLKWSSSFFEQKYPAQIQEVTWQVVD
jgi:hypothetical protein